VSRDYDWSICYGETHVRQRDGEIKRKEEAMAKQKRTMMSFFKKPAASPSMSGASPAGPSSKSTPHASRQKLTCSHTHERTLAREGIGLPKNVQRDHDEAECAVGADQPVDQAGTAESGYIVSRRDEKVGTSGVFECD
jgi:hypothetical protein